VRVRLPKGVDDGALLRVPRKGAPSPAGAGDLYLRVHYLPDPRFERRGKDLHAELQVSLAEAALGGDMTVATPDGPVRIRIPQGTPSGRKIRLNEKGIPTPKGKRGDLYLDVRIIPPPAPNEEERAILEQFAKTSGFNPRES
jgi:curved DNA-binding protein